MHILNITHKAFLFKRMFYIICGFIVVDDFHNLEFLNLNVHQPYSLLNSTLCSNLSTCFCDGSSYFPSLVYVNGTIMLLEGVILLLTLLQDCTIVFRILVSFLQRNVFHWSLEWYKRLSCFNEVAISGTIKISFSEIT